MSTSCTNDVIYDANDNSIQATITDVDDAPVIDAAVSVVLKRLDGTEILASTSMPHTANGVYRGTSPAATALPVGKRINAEVTVSSPTAGNGFFVKRLRVLKRSS